VAAGIHLGNGLAWSHKVGPPEGPLLSMRKRGRERARTLHTARLALERDIFTLRRRHERHCPDCNHFAFAVGANLSSGGIPDVSRHKSMDVLQAYVRDADMFRDHAGAGLL
jgi:hypothetical protein